MTNILLPTRAPLCPFFFRSIAPKPDRTSTEWGTNRVRLRYGPGKQKACKDSALPASRPGRGRKRLQCTSGQQAGAWEKAAARYNISPTPAINLQDYSYSGFCVILPLTFISAVGKGSNSCLPAWKPASAFFWAAMLTTSVGGSTILPASSLTQSN